MPSDPSPEWPLATALDRLSDAEVAIASALFPETRAYRQARWRLAYFRAFRLLMPGRSYVYRGNVVSRADDRLLYDPFLIDRWRAS